MRPYDNFETLFIGVRKEIGKAPAELFNKYDIEGKPYLDLLLHFWKEKNWVKFVESVKVFRDFWLKKIEKEK